MGRPETDRFRQCAMTQLGNGLFVGAHHEEALSVREADLSMRRRLGASEGSILVVQENLAITYERLGRLESALQMKHDVYSGRLKLYGKQHEATLLAANNYAVSLVVAERFEEAKALLLKAKPLAQRVLGEGDTTTLRMRLVYGDALYLDPGATLDDLREAVTTLEEIERTARRVFGGAHPLTTGIEDTLRDARLVLGGACRRRHARRPLPLQVVVSLREEGGSGGGRSAGGLYWVIIVVCLYLAFAGAERGSRLSQILLHHRRDRMRATEHAPRGPFRLLERIYGLAEIVERGASVVVDCQRAIPPHPDRSLIILSEDASRHGHHFAQQQLGLCEAP